MDKNAVWKWLILIAATAWSLSLVMPLTDQYDDDGRLVQKGKLKLGLDLQGGTSFTLEVDDSELDEDAKKDSQQRALEVIRNRIDNLGIEEPIIYPEPNSKRIVVQIPGLKEEERDRAANLIRSAAFLEFRMVSEENDILVEQVLDQGLAPHGYKVVSVSQQLSNGQTIERQYYKEIDEGTRKDMSRELEIKSITPPGHELLMKKEVVREQTLYVPYFVNKRRVLTGEALETAGIDYQQMGQPMVTLKFDGEGADKFADVTRDYAPGGEKNPNPEGRRYLAIVLDGTLYSAPFIKSAIYGGNAIIEGDFSLKEATDLSIVLRAGSLPAPVNIIEERGVDPSLGKDSVESGKRAALYGGIAVLVFMLLYYLLAGVVANLALLLDVILLPLGMMMAAGFLGLLIGDQSGGGAGLPTLTLPGIAGIVLTIGMAVDANVLIFERIREEQIAGKRLRNAIDAGYDKVFSTIFDANITTLLTAVILFWKGSGPIRGFAVTLSAGIIVSMFIALVVTRMFFNIIANHTSVKKIHMLSIVRNSNINFLSMRYVAVVLSTLVILGTGFMFLQRGEDNFGVDFTGGRSITYEFAERKSVEEVRTALDQQGVSDAFIQYQKELAPDADGVQKEYLVLKVGYEEGPAATNAMGTAFSDADFQVVKQDSVGPQVGEELKKQGLTAIIVALIGIVIYISIRFEFAFAMGAIAALAHDVLITIGIYCLLGRQLSLPIVAALLTIVGYSVNDTIVVFDRIREDLKLIKGKSYKEIANLSINQTLGRTLLTSITTLLTITMLLVFGGGAINDFALALFIGVLVGTYSSIFVATPIMLLWHKEDKAKAKA